MYRDMIVETYRAYGEQSHNAIRARPVAGQGFDTSMNVECSSKMRRNHEVGTKFKIRAKITDREGGSPFIYTSYRWPYVVLSDSEADQFIKEHYGK